MWTIRKSPKISFSGWKVLTSPWRGGGSWRCFYSFLKIRICFASPTWCLSPGRVVIRESVFVWSCGPKASLKMCIVVMTHWPVKLSNNTNHMYHYLLRKHHWLRNIHLPQGCAGACGLCGAVAHRLGVWRRDLCSGFHVLRWAGCHHSQVWRRLFLRDGDLWRPCGVNSGLIHIVISFGSYRSPGWACAQGGWVHAQLTGTNWP